MSKPIIVFTAIFGDSKDRLQKLPDFGSAVQCHAFLENVTEDGTQGGWLIHPARFKHDDPRRRARMHKCNPHLLFPDAEISMWVDGTMTPHTHPERLVERYLAEEDLCTYRHSQRSCVYQEAEMCARMRKDKVSLIRAQVERYRGERYPYHNGLAETMVILRRHTDAIKTFNELWWKCIDEGSARDQLSFDYACWRVGIRYKHFDRPFNEQKDFSFRSHW